MSICDFLRALTDKVILSSIIAMLNSSVRLVGSIRVTSLVYIRVSNPPTQLSTNSHKSRVFGIDELGHIHMVAVYTDGDMTRQDG